MSIKFTVYSTSYVSSYIGYSFILWQNSYTLFSGLRTSHNLWYIFLFLFFFLNLIFKSFCFSFQQCSWYLIIGKVFIWMGTKRDKNVEYFGLSSWTGRKIFPETQMSDSYHLKTNVACKCVRHSWGNGFYGLYLKVNLSNY